MPIDAFLAAGHQPDIGCVEQRIQHIKVALAGDTEGHVDSMSAQRRDDQLAAAEKSLVRRHHLPRPSWHGGHLSRCRQATEEAFPAVLKTTNFGFAPRRTGAAEQKTIVISAA